MRNLASQRCTNHADREAVAICLACKRYFCRECITEHDDRLICASCLRKMSGSARPVRLQGMRLLKAFQFFVAIMLIWLFFFLTGKALLALPASFHEGTLWTSSWLEEDK